MSSEALLKFEEQLRSLISEKTEGGESTTLIHKSQIEQIGAELDMSTAQSNTQFFALRGSVWDVVSMDSSMIDGDKTGGLPPPRNWSAINDVYLQP